ncbi:saccharopine dehydrogenase [Nocardia sp. CDC159]|uniref:Saccharopine dehydrogenase n=1 Tax=Nocardia pulmonis TaxID=2951408 RepID=A0A9X2E6Q1_9NOCA|nr:MULTISPECIES: saccharopine dehydrogenase [Nocardia]MCM6772513.1 saccharopine dehydrogenase [Nocardia pulmonis]MCM6784829.1 saccharopine dehydrogenase [Nocardia sp. CDC159]
MAAQPKSVLILGGSGQAGAGAAHMLRRWHPSLPLTLAGRDRSRLRRVAEELGDAETVTIDLDRDDLGLTEHEHTAVVAALWDRRLRGLRYAQRHGLPYLSISSGLAEIGPEVIAGAQRPSAAPILLASHFFAGLATLAVLHEAARFARVDSVRVSAILDETDTGGPAGLADVQRLMAAGDAALVRRDGVFTWLPAAEAQVRVRGMDGVELAGQSIAVPDVPSVALAADAANVRFDWAIGESGGRRRGGSPTAEIAIDLEGVDRSGAPRRVTRYVVHPDGQRPLTALGIALGVERLLGLRGELVAPGIHTPESLIDPTHAVERMREIGTVFADA